MLLCSTHVAIGGTFASEGGLWYGRYAQLNNLDRRQLPLDFCGGLEYFMSPIESRLVGVIESLANEIGH